MTFDPVLWLLIYLLVGSLIWLVSWCAGDFEAMPDREAARASLVLIAGWLPVAGLTVAACRFLASEDQP